MNNNSTQYHEDAVVKNLLDVLYELLSSEDIKTVWPENLEGEHSRTVYKNDFYPLVNGIRKLVTELFIDDQDGTLRYVENIKEKLEELGVTIRFQYIKSKWGIIVTTPKGTIYV